MTPGKSNRDSSSAFEPDHLLIEKLIDGELSPQQRRELLSRLDQQPQGWRRCALAFLEAQAMEEELGALVREAAGPVGPREVAPQPRVSTPARRAFWTRHVPSALAVAASFLVALWIGANWGPSRSPSPRQAAEMTSTEATANRKSFESEDFPGNLQPESLYADRQPAGFGEGSLPGSMEFINPNRGGSRPSSSDAPWETVTLAVDGGTSSNDRAIQLPAMPRDRLDQQWLDELPTAMPPDVLSALRRSGHEVRQQRQVFPLRMRDGRKLYVPIDDVEVEYRGTRGYQ